MHTVGPAHMQNKQKLTCVQVDETQIVSNNPFKGSQIQSSLQTRHGCNVVLLSKEAHTNIVPQLRRIGSLVKCIW